MEKIDKTDFKLIAGNGQANSSRVSTTTAVDLKRREQLALLRAAIVMAIQTRRHSRGLPTLPAPEPGHEQESELFLQVESWLPIIRFAGIPANHLVSVQNFALGFMYEPGAPFGAEDVARAWPEYKALYLPVVQDPPAIRVNESPPLTKEQIIEQVQICKEVLRKADPFKTRKDEQTTDK